MTNAQARQKRRFRPAEKKSTKLAKTLRRKMTHAEVLLWQALRRQAMDGLRFRRQHPIGPYAADFACVPIKLVVEVDGATHGTDEELEHDRRRRDYMARRGWRELRFWNSDVYEDLFGVTEAIWRTVQEMKAAAPSTASRSPSPASRGG